MKKVLLILIALIFSISFLNDLSAAVRRKVVKPVPKKVAPVKPKAVEPKAVTPTPAPVEVAPQPAPVSPVVQPAKKPSLFSVGVKAGLNSGVLGAVGDFDYVLSQILKGLSARVSLGYVSGNNPNSTATRDNPMASVVAKIGANYVIDGLKIANLPVDWYVGGAYLIPVRTNDARSGGWGVEAVLGGKYSGDDAWKLYVESGYSGLKYDTNVAALKGLGFTVGYSYTF